MTSFAPCRTRWPRVTELYRVEALHLSLPDLCRKPLLGVAPRINILKGLKLPVHRGEVLGIVGGSGSGKSTLGWAMVRLLQPTAGRVVFDGQDITHLSEAVLRPLRRRFQMIFQDPMSGLNPRPARSPDFILTVEIVPGLDVSSQAQLLERPVAELGLTLAFISHDLSVIRRLCSRMLVLHQGQIVETAKTERLFVNPQAAYS